MSKQPNFADCVAQHLPFLTRVVRSVMRGDQMAEDIVQQTVLKAVINADQFRFQSALKTWLVSIAINEARQAYRCGWHKRAVPLITENIDLIRFQPPEFSDNNYLRHIAVLSNYAIFSTSRCAKQRSNWA
jgi:RNA polymerase sigma factor (sigma-70 family)